MCCVHLYGSVYAIDFTCCVCVWSKHQRFQLYGLWFPFSHDIFFARKCRLDAHIRRESIDKSLTHKYLNPITFTASLTRCVCVFFFIHFDMHGILSLLFFFISRFIFDFSLSDVTLTGLTNMRTGKRTKCVSRFVYSKWKKWPYIAYVCARVRMRMWMQKIEIEKSNEWILCDVVFCVVFGSATNNINPMRWLKFYEYFMKHWPQLIDHNDCCF